MRPLLPILAFTALVTASANAQNIPPKALLNAAPPAQQTVQERFVVVSGALSADQVVTTPPSTALGGQATAVLVFDREEQTITTYLNFRGLTGPARFSHIHAAPAGEPFHV